MNNISILQSKVEEYLNGDRNITDVNSSEEKLGVQITASYYNDIHFECLIRNKGDMATIKTECAFNHNDPEIDESVVAKNIIGDREGVMSTAYDGNCVFQKVVSYAKEEDNKAASILVNEIIGLFEIVNNGLSQFKHSEVKAVKRTPTQPVQEPVNITKSQPVTEPIQAPVAPAQPEPVVNSVPDTPVQSVQSRPSRPKRTRRSAATILNGIKDDTDLEPAQDNNTPARTENKAVKESVVKSEPVESAKPAELKESAQTDGKSSRSHNTGSYAVSSETKKQVDALYSEMNELFDQRKKDADEREKFLNEYSKSLTAKEAELEEQKQANIRELTLAKAEQESEYKNKKKELEEEYTKKTAELEKDYLDKEDKLLQREAELDSISENLEVEKQTIDFTWKKIDVEKASLEEKSKALEEKTAIFEKLKKEAPALKEVSTSGSNDSAKIKALADELDSLNDEMDALEEENENLASERDMAIQERDDLLKLNEELSKENDNMEKSYRGLQSKYDKLVASSNSASTPVPTSDNSAELEEKDSEIRQLKAEIETLQRDNKVLSETSQSSDDETAEIIKNLRTELDEMKSKNTELEANFNEAKDKYITLESELKVANDKLINMPSGTGTSTEPEDISVKAQQVKSDLAKLGINVEFVAGAGSEDMVLHGNANNSLIVVNVKANVLYIEKKVKKVKTYLAPIETWNQEDIRVTYGVHENNIICKYTYDDISTAITKSFEKFNSLT